MKYICKLFKSKLFITGITFILIIVLFIGFKGTDDKTKVWVLAKKEVTNQLKSPSSAKFPSKDKGRILDLNDEYIVTGYVDAQNSFGTTIRSKFSVTFTKDSDGGFITKSVYVEN